MTSRTCDICSTEFEQLNVEGRPRKLCYDPRCLARYKNQWARNKRYDAARLKEASSDREELQTIEP